MGGVPRDWYRTCSFSPRAAQKLKFPKLFFDIVTPQNDHLTNVKHVVGRICVFFTLHGHCVRGGGGLATTPYFQHAQSAAPPTKGAHVRQRNRECAPSRARGGGRTRLSPPALAARAPKPDAPPPPLALRASSGGGNIPPAGPSPANRRPRQPGRAMKRPRYRKFFPASRGCWLHAARGWTNDPPPPPQEREGAPLHRHFPCPPCRHCRHRRGSPPAPRSCTRGGKPPCWPWVSHSSSPRRGPHRRVSTQCATGGRAGKTHSPDPLLPLGRSTP